MKYLLVGETPNKSCVGEPRLWLLPDKKNKSCAASRLLEASGLTLREYLRAFDRTNLAKGLPPRAGKGRKFPMATARKAARRILLDDRRPGIVVLGKRAARAFGLTDPRWFEWTDALGQRVVVIPHPSGVNRYYNDEENRALTRRFFEELVSGHDRRDSRTVGRNKERRGPRPALIV